MTDLYHKSRLTLPTIPTGLDTSLTDFLQQMRDVLENYVHPLADDVSVVGSIADTATTDITTLQSDVSTLQTDMTTAQGDITTLQGDMTTTQGDIDNLELQRSPIGSVVAWLKSLTGTPSLSANWVECNGQTISDGDSPYNGVTIPNLNASGGGTKRFLRGSTTSGTTGGVDTVTLTAAQSGLPSHSHSYTAYEVNTNYEHDGIGNIQDFLYGRALSSTRTETVGSTGGTAASSSHDNLPSYYEVVYIMRIK